MKRKNGFTLLELMVTIAIGAILVVLAVPSFEAIVANMRLKSATQDLFSTLQQTRISAIRTNSRWAVEFVDTNTTYTLNDCGPDNDCSTTDDNVTTKSIDLSEYPGVTLQQNFGSDRAVFNSEGSSNAGTITLTNSKAKSSSIVISPTGRIRIS
ncbi:MAG: GspH/FimT family pseudopilin [Desulfatirhabdiaceae bacterium]